VPGRGAVELDARGAAVAPDFIDVHSHDDFAVLMTPDMPFSEGVLDLPTAIHRMTGMPAAKFRLADRGAIRAGAFADLVVFDSAAIRDTATYDDPRRFPEGIRAVYVNGMAVAQEGRHTGARPGRALRRA
jgi:N-acyl-D-amino-acid deacylase